MFEPLVNFMMKLFSSKIKIVFNGTEAAAFVRNEKVPFLFNCADKDMKVSIKRLFEKVAELQNKYFRVSMARPDIEFDVTAFSGDKESFKIEVIELLKDTGFRLAVLIDGTKRLILFE
jgi:hypothetical protein